MLLQICEIVCMLQVRVETESHMSQMCFFSSVPSSSLPSLLSGSCHVFDITIDVLNDKMLQ
jgi:hypothetical protein